MTAKWGQQHGGSVEVCYSFARGLGPCEAMGPTSDCQTKPERLHICEFCWDPHNNKGCPIYKSKQAAKQQTAEMRKKRGFAAAKSTPSPKHPGQGQGQGNPAAKALAARKAISRCAVCGQIGHWKGDPSVRR